MKEPITQELLDHLDDIYTPDNIIRIYDGESELFLNRVEKPRSNSWMFYDHEKDEETALYDLGEYPTISLQQARKFYQDWLRVRLNEVSEALAYEESKEGKL